MNTIVCFLLCLLSLSALSSPADMLTGVWISENKSFASENGGWCSFGNGKTFRIILNDNGLFSLERDETDYWTFEMNLFGPDQFSDPQKRQLGPDLLLSMASKSEVVDPQFLKYTEVYSYYSIGKQKVVSQEIIEIESRFDDSLRRFEMTTFYENTDPTTPMKRNLNRRCLFSRD